MSPAKRLSRRRFRALCERCNRFCTPGPMPLRDEMRVVRFARRTHRRNGCDWLFAHVRALARLAR